MTKTTILDTMNETANAFGTLNKGQQELFDTLVLAFEATAGRAKIVEDDGQQFVWCNFHNTYEPASEFTMRANKKGDLVYRSNCADATKLISKMKRTSAKAERVTLEAFRAKLISADVMTLLLADIDTAKAANDFDALLEIVKREEALIADNAEA